MPRRKPASAKQRKAELQLKRAIKRGDVPAPPSAPHRGGKGEPRGGGSRSVEKPRDPSSKRLQSAFLKIESPFLEISKSAASNEVVERPIPKEGAILRLDEVGLDESAEKNGARLTCPRRPKWRFDMSKKEVEANEEGIYKKWIVETDEQIAEWRASRPLVPSTAMSTLSQGTNIPGSPTYYERNLEVWRQLWRVAEISQIILVLLDSRCPALHFPPSLQAYLSSFRPPRPFIIILTKSDMVPESYSNAWSTWLQAHHPSVKIVKARSYRGQHVQEERNGQGQRKTFQPEIATDELKELVVALKAVHQDLVTPPEGIRDDKEKSKHWKPLVPIHLDWDAVLLGSHGDILDHEGDESEFLTVGLIGQPNVGKSSLLNALFGTHKVKASRTPGKTKHFQTLFWTNQIRLVDCPGLVLPNFVPMELQVLCSILPISQIPSIPTCIHYVLKRLPLENILNLEHASPGMDIILDKRTWRGARPSNNGSAPERKDSWTTMDVLNIYAIKKGWVTAKAGRPDANRAGNALLRALAEGRIRWAFWPPNIPTNDAAIQPGLGIWLGEPLDETEETHSDVDSEGIRSYSHEGGDKEETETEEESHKEEGEDNRERVDVGLTVGGGRFGALSLDIPTDDEEEAEEN